MTGEIHDARHDAMDGMRGAYGYSTYFESDHLKSFVLDMLTDMEFGRPTNLHPPLDDLPHDHPTYRSINAPSPHLICANEETSGAFNISVDVLAYCDTNPDRYAFVQPDTSMLFICPAFWKTETRPDRRVARCPMVEVDLIQVNDQRWRRMRPKAL